jgi:phage terminase large subunit GpA-like protein
MENLANIHPGQIDNPYLGILPEVSEPEKITTEPPEKLPIAEWMEKYRFLGGHTEEKGNMRISRTPYLGPLLEWIVKPSVTELVLMKPAQIGGTEIMISIMGYFSREEPCPILLVMADQATAEYMGRERIQPMFRDSEELAKLIGRGVFSKTEIELINRAYIAVAWASSVAGLGSRSFRIVIMDEVDKPGYRSSLTEAAPISLARERSETFFSRKHLLLSTPTLETGNICTEIEMCDAVYDWHVPCPFCGLHQPLRWSREHSWGFQQEGYFKSKDGKFYPLGQVAWEGRRNATSEQIERAGYQCGNCERIWNTIQKNNAVENGEVVSRNGHHGEPKKIGLHINRLYSLLGLSGDIPALVDNWLKVIKGGDPKKIQGFVNSTLAEPWREVVIKVSDSEILKARCELPPRNVPEDAVALTCGIDVQRAGFWYVVRAWGKNWTSWLIDYQIIQGWDELENLLFNTKYAIHNRPGHVMKIFRAVIDTGGGRYGDAEISMVEETYYWIRQNRGRGCQIFGSKGASRPMDIKIKFGKPLDRTPSGKPLPGGLQLALIDTGAMKDLFHFRLNQATFDGETMPAYLHRETDEEYVSHITAEEKRLEDGVQVWKQIRTNNHLLDAEVLSMASAEPEWIGGGINMVPSQRISEIDREVPYQQGRKKNPWLGRNSQWLR